MAKVSVQHWQYHDGVTPINPGSQWPIVPPRSWTCWVYPENDNDFVEWMNDNCPSAECIHRFNGGDPMYTVSITDEKECTMFKLKWA